MSTTVTGPVVRMTRDHIVGLLRTILALDPRTRPSDPETAQAKADAWGKILVEVDPQFAFNVVHRYYAETPEHSIMPGQIINAWRAEQTAARVAARQAPQEALPGAPEPASFAKFMRELIAAAHEGRDHSTVPRPPGHPPSMLNGQERSRLCVFHDICACEHTVCRDGWLDDEVAVEHPWGGGRKHRTVKRCPHCHDALKMAEERGIAKKPNRWRGARR